MKQAADPRGHKIKHCTNPINSFQYYKHNIIRAKAVCILITVLTSHL